MWPSGPVTAGGVQRALARAEDRVERPLATVCERQRPGVVARSLHSAAHRGRCLACGEAAAKLVGATEDRHSYTRLRQRLKTSSIAPRVPCGMST